MRKKRFIKDITKFSRPVSDFWIRIFLIQLCVFTPSLFAGWFFEDHYYDITYKFSSTGGILKATAIGKPSTEGPFSVYTSYPDKKEVRIKTEHILRIVDTGTKSPEKLKNEQLVKIFGLTPKDLQLTYTLTNINLARSKNISNRDIFIFLCSINKSYEKFHYVTEYTPIENFISPNFDPNLPFTVVEDATAP
jgi:hypothetical protein